MGLIYSNFYFFLDQKRKLKSNFLAGITLGRQQVYLRDDKYNYLCEKFDLDRILLPEFGKCDDIFLEKTLGCTISSADYSDYEGAELVHDFNLPLSEKYHGKYDLVIDGGSLEHVFNFPQALANCMNLLSVGGSLFIFTMANNFMGHGFYQFSPELFYRALCEDNGFKVEDMVLFHALYPGVEFDDNIQHWRVADPVVVKSRVGLVSGKPGGLMVHAVKTANMPVFEKYPIQSDYAATYEKAVQTNVSNQKASVQGKIKDKLRPMLPQKMLNARVGKAQLRDYSVNNSRFYEKLEW